MKYLLSVLTIAAFLSGCTTTASQYPEGYVQLRFDISEEGTTENIKVIKSVPSGFFDKEAIRALSRWKYEPKLENGIAVRQVGILVQLDFNSQQ